MEKKKPRIRIVAAAVIVAWLIVPTEAGQKIQYSLNLRKGQSYYVRVISDSIVAQEMAGQTSVVQVTSGFGYRFDVKEVDQKGNGWVDCTFDWVKFRQKAPMMEVAYDSADKSSPVPLGAQRVAVFLGAGFSAKITPQGQAEEVKATEQLRKNIETQIPEGPERKQMLDAFEKQQLAEYIKEICLAPMAVYPDKPVGIGDSWSRMVSYKTQSLVLDNKWTLKDRKAGSAIIEASSTVKSNPEGPQDAAVKMKDISGKVHGQIEIKESTGQIIRSKMSQDLSGQIQAEAMRISMNTHGVATFELTESKGATGKAAADLSRQTGEKAPGSGQLEGRIAVPLTIDDSICTDGVGSVTLKDLGDEIMWETERAADSMMGVRYPRLRSLIFTGEGSEIRVSGSLTMHIGQMIVPHGSRVCLKKSGGDWVYVCGLGVYLAHGKTTPLGFTRTVDSCLAMLSSDDDILREGAARDLGRLTKQPDVGRVIAKLIPLLKDPSASVRQGAAEGLGLIGSSECADALKEALVRENHNRTSTFISEALAVCGGYVLVGDPDAAQMTDDEASLYMLAIDLKNTWVTQVVVIRAQRREAEARRVLLNKESVSRGPVAAAVTRLLDAMMPQRYHQWIQAATNGDLQGVCALLPNSEIGRIPQKYVAQAIDAAVVNGHAAIVEFLLEKAGSAQKNYLNAMPDDNTRVRPLVAAARSGHTEIVKLLLERGANIDAPGNTFGGTALIEATRSGHTEVVKLLLERGADVNASNTFSGTALSAAMGGYLRVQNKEQRVRFEEIVKLLLDAGARR